MRVSPSLSPACFVAPLHNIAFMHPNVFASPPPSLSLSLTYSLFLFNVTLVAASTLKVPGLLSRLCRQFSLPQIELESLCVTPVILCARQWRGLCLVKFCTVRWFTGGLRMLTAVRFDGPFIVQVTRPRISTTTMLTQLPLPSLVRFWRGGINT